jgi:hypothetical protein
VLCGVPAKAELVAWAERGGASTGIIAVEMPSTGLKRLDLGLDSTATIASSSGRAHVDSATLEGEARRPPARTGTRMLRGVVRGYEGNAVTNARVRVIGQRFANTDSRGAFTLDSLPGGSQTLEVRALGYVPVVEAVDVSARGTAVDTVVLASSKGLLDTVRVTATGKSNVDRTGFEMRRHGVGTYLTRSDVLARRPLETTGLFTATPGVFVQSQGFATTVKMGAPGSGYCTPALWIDGSLQASTSASTGPALPSAAAAFQSSTIPRKGDTTAPPNRTAADPALHMEEGPITELNQLVVPAEIEGIEIYRRMSEVPPQFEPSGTFSCGAIVIWTRLRFELPAPPADGKP